MIRRGDIFTACCVTGLGLSAAVLRLLKDPTSRLSRWVDRNVLPDGVTR